MPEWHVHHFDELSSTQDVARDKARSGAVEGTVIVAKHQTAGRGRNGNKWETLTGNLVTSFILRPTIELAQAAQYSFLIAISLNRALNEFLEEPHSILNKWPNDILVDGKKIAGILLEVEGEALIIGIGVNIASAPVDRVFLHQVARERVSSEDFLQVMLANIHAVLEEYERDGFDGMREEWLEHAANLHQTILAQLPNETFSGVFEGLDVDGALRLRLANGEIKVIHSGEIFFG